MQYKFATYSLSFDFILALMAWMRTLCNENKVYKNIEGAEVEE